MFQRIIDAIRIASRDPSQIPLLGTLSESIIDWDDQQIDLLLKELMEWGEELRESEDHPAERVFEPLSAAGSSASRLPKSMHGLDRALQPVVHHLVVREMKRKLNSHIIPKPLQGNLEKKSLSSPAPETSSRTETSPTTLTASHWSGQRFRAVETLYQLAPTTSDLRNHLLRWIGTAGGKEHFDLWLELVCNDPPENRLGIGLAFAPLMQSNFIPTQTLLDDLLNKGASHSQIAPAVFDLFNYFVRNKRVPAHPCLARLDQQVVLLGQLCGQLGRVEEGDFPKNFHVREINQLVSDSVALIVALCDTFALTEHHAAIPKLYQALQLRHRRVQTEAAAALVRLKDETGKQALIALAEQPIARLRVLAYAEELGFKQEISLELQGEIALAESQLAIWLAEPDQMGLAPSKLELVDNRLMYWPSYDQPIQCYLFKYSYGSGPSSHCNIGLCGPITHAFAADLRHLPTDEIYGAFAGWQTVHDEIFQMSLARAKQTYPNEVRRRERSLQDDTFEDLRIQTVGSFFGELVLVASAVYEGQAGTLVVDSHDTSWFEVGNADAPIDWRLAYSIWRGKQLLSRFNSDENGD